MPTSLLQLTEQQNDQALDIARGGRVIISLGSNHDTGYAWTLDGAMPAQLEEDGAATYEAPPARMGAWGREVFTFVAAVPGSGKLRLKYARDSDNGARPSRTFSIILNVRSNGAGEDDWPSTPRRAPVKKPPASQNSAVITRKAATKKTAKAPAEKKPAARKSPAKKAAKR